MGFILRCNDQSISIEAFLKINNSIHDRFNFAENMINCKQSEIKTSVIICQSTLAYVLLDTV